MENIRPASLSEFVGQTQAIAILKIHLASARKRNAPMPHVLMAGPAGLGKTSLAKIVASETGGRLREVVGGTIKTPADVAKLLGDLRSGDTLFIDEIHAVQRSVEELFYSALEDGTLTVENKSCDKMFRDLGLGGSKASTKSIKRLPPFTMVGATTQLGEVSSPLRSRFHSILTLLPYTLEEMGAIVLRTAKQLELSMSGNVATEVARRSKGIARIAVSNVHWLRDYALAHGCRLTAKSAQDAFSLKGIDAHGMTPADRMYLGKLIASAEAVGIETLAAIMGESVDTVAQAIEPFLLAQGFVEKTPRGRIATAKARSIKEIAA